MIYRWKAAFVRSFLGCCTCLGEVIIARRAVIKQEGYCFIALAKVLPLLHMNDQFRHSVIRWARGGVEND